MTDLAYAMGLSGGEGGQSGGLAALAPLIIMFVIFYFLLIRPQQKKAKTHREFLTNLHKGDRIITTGGLYGEITGLTDTIITLEIAPKIRVKVSRSHVAGLAQAAPQSSAAEEKSETS
ncbi:MAG: preprotein translocase subunit YajC [Thermodesulfobacteriota bacterium]